MIESSFQLFIQALQENNIQPEKLKAVLESYCLTIEEYLRISNKAEDEVTFIVLKDTTRTVESFSHLIDLTINFPNPKFP